ncbi:MAG: chemotaxis protein CheW, partial [Aeromonadaceae bacterium]
YRELRGRPLPLINLRRHFEIEGERAKRENIVVVSHGKNHLGLVVDHLLGEQQIVIKPLGSIFSQLRDISGSSILGSGQVALILDIPGMLQRMHEQELGARHLDS